LATSITVILIILGLILGIAGLVGCILPMLPGPPLSYIALIILSFARNWEPFSTTFLIVMAVLTGIVLILDYIVPAAGAKKYGASKWGIWGSVFGMILGLFVFPPFGLFLGGFAGAFAGELLAGKGNEAALRAGWGVLFGNVVGIGIKLGLCAVLLFYYVTNIF
jgi:uncharacterized protein YqgC (DUF456 family)